MGSRLQPGATDAFRRACCQAALNDFWHGRTVPARRKVLEVIADWRKSDSRHQAFWDDKAGIPVDYFNYGGWLALSEGKRDVSRHFTFKLGVLLHAIRVLGLVSEIGAPLQTMKRRLWSAQTGSGGVAHSVDDRATGEGTPWREPTGEASAIKTLSEAVDAKARWESLERILRGQRSF
jgi:hypothetical protein